MKHTYLSTAVVAALIQAPAALAEHRLFPTAILDRGEIDAKLGLLRGHAANSFQMANGAHANQTLDRRIERIDVRYGLAAHWHVGLALRNDPTYVVRTNFDNGPSFLDSRNQGQQNPEFWAKYGFVDDRNSPYSLSGELRIVPNTNDRHSASEEARLVGGRDFGSGSKAYVAYSASVPHDPNYSQAHTVAAGIFKTLTDRISIIPNISYSHIAANDIRAATHEYGGELAALVQIERNTYVRPGAALYRVASHARRDGTARWGATQANSLSISLYHLF